MTLCTPCWNDERADGTHEHTCTPRLADNETCGRCGRTLREEIETLNEKRHSDDGMSFGEYQKKSKRTAIGFADPDTVDKYDEKVKLLFLATALNGEAGEVGEKMKKYVREGDEAYLDGAEDELGDLLWYVSQLASLLDADLSEIAEGNLEKLLDRQERGQITGEGDNR